MRALPTYIRIALGLLAMLVLLLIPSSASAQKLANVSIAPSSILGGNGVTGSIKLTSTAGAGGFPVTVTFAHPFIQAPSTVVVPNGSSSTTFPIGTSAVPTNRFATILFSDGTQTLSASFQVLASVTLSAVSISPGTVVGGNSVTGTVRLTNPADTGGFVVSLSSSQAYVQVPASVTVLEGDQTANFPITTSEVSTLKSATVTFSASGSPTLKASVQVLQNPAVSGLTLSNPAVLGGLSITGKVTIDEAAPPGGTVVELSSDQASAQVPATVTVPRGARAATFPITTTQVISEVTAQISANAQTTGGTSTASLVVSASAPAKTAWPKFHQNSQNSGLGAASGSDGTVKWSVGIGEGMYGGAAIGSDGTLYVAGGNSFYAITPEGSIKWSFNTGDFIYSTPAVGVDGTVYCAAGNSRLYAMNSNGTKKWVFKTGDLIFASPTIGSDGTIYVSSADHNLYAVNPDGTQKWAFLTGDFIFSSPAIATDGTIYVGWGDSNLYAINPNGTKKWAFQTGGVINNGGPTVDEDGTIYFGSIDKNVYAVNPNGTQKWSFATGSFVASSPAIGTDGTIYVGSDDENLYALNPNGTQKWAFKTGGFVLSSPAAGQDGTVYFGSNDGHVYAVNADGTQKWAYDTGRGVSSSPAIGSDGTIYVGSIDSNFYAFGPAVGGGAVHASWRRSSRDASLWGRKRTTSHPHAVSRKAS